MPKNRASNTDIFYCAMIAELNAYILLSGYSLPSGT
jgi:hypothetical protein